MQISNDDEKTKKRVTQRLHCGCVSVYGQIVEMRNLKRQYEQKCSVRQTEIFGFKIFKRRSIEAIQWNKREITNKRISKCFVEESESLTKRSKENRSSY